MTSDFDKQQWQAEQAERERITEREREKFARLKARSARNAQRKIDRLRAKLKDAGDLTDWEEEFSESVSERLDKFGSAFQDPQKGRPADALSFAQKRVVAALKQKAKGKDKDKGQEKGSGFRSKGGFKSKAKPKFTPRVRHLEDEMGDDETENVFLPEYKADNETPKKPFLRIVK